MQITKSHQSLFKKKQDQEDVMIKNGVESLAMIKEQALKYNEIMK